MQRTGPMLVAIAVGLVASPACAQDADNWTIAPRGRIQYDVGDVDAPSSISADGLEVVDEFRAIRLGAQGRLAGAIDFLIEVDFSQNDFVLVDATLGHTTGPVTFTLGHQKNLTGLEELTSALNTSFVERAAFTDAFGFERRVGFAVSYAGADHLVSAGAFTDDFDALTNDENDGYSLDARAAWFPEIGERTRLHLGGAVHWRDIREPAALRYRQRPLLHATDIRFISTPTLPTEEELSYGIEAALVRGSFHATGEAHWFRPTLAGGADSPTYFGGYVEAGIFLTPGDTRGYRAGRFDRVRPSRPLGEGGIGAVQINARYDRLDLNGAGVVGGTQDLIGGSLVWTPQDRYRLMLNYARIDYADAAIPTASGDRDYGVDVVALRAQVSY